MASLIMLCGKVASGKTTFAQKLEDEGKAFLLSADEWMIQLFGQNLSSEEHFEKLEQCKRLIYCMTDRLLKQGISVVLDFGFWTREERDHVRERFANFHVELIYFECNDEELKERIKERNMGLYDYNYKITDDMLQVFNINFEEPTPDENSIIIKR